MKETYQHYFDQEIVGKLVGSGIVEEDEIIGIDFVDVGNSTNSFNEWVFQKDIKKYLELLKEQYFAEYPSLIFDPQSFRLISNAQLNEALHDEVVSSKVQKQLVYKRNIQIDRKFDLNQFNKNDFDRFWDVWLEICNSDKSFPSFSHIAFANINSKNNTLHTCGIFVYLRKPGGLSTEQDKNVLRSILKEIVLKRVVDIILPRQISSLKKSSLKSSLAAVMSRNMSHNIGSHVLNKLSSASEIQKFFALKGEKRFVVAKPPKEEFTFPNLSISSEELNKNMKSSESKEETPLETFTKKLKENPNYLEQYKFSTFIGEKDIYTISPFFVDVNNNTTKEELARVFNDYLKKRMDFVADVATSNKALLSSTKFLFADVFRGFERNLLLLQYISGKEDKFSYEFNFEYCDGSSNGPYKYGKEGFIDPVVAVPNDVLGNQAFYIILENIIRNTAKHSGVGKVVFTIKVEDLPDDSFYSISIFDDVSDNGIEQLVATRNINIAQEVLDKNNEIRTAGWGTIEIKLAACYLSGLNMLEMDSELFAPIGYPAFAKAKKEYHKENPQASKKELTDVALDGYRKFLKKQNESTYHIAKNGSQELREVKESADWHYRTYKNKKNETVKRYPIVQAIKASEEGNKGFGYRFLMKKPKKLLIIDQSDSLAQYVNKSTSNNSEVDNDTINKRVSQLQRLGIEIVKEPKSGTIYNHEFMIIIGDSTSKLYGDWFNLPQERCWYDLNEKSYQYFKTNKRSHPTKNEYKYELVGDKIEVEESIYDIFKKDDISLSKLLKPLKVLCYNNMNLHLFPCIQEAEHLNTEGIDQLRLSDDNWLKNYHSSLSDIWPNKASFDHHGNQSKNTFLNSCYAEVYGSVSPIGLYLENLSKKINAPDLLLEDIVSENQFFFTKGVNSKVLIIDERIQNVLHDVGATIEAGENFVGYTLTYKELFDKSNILIPDRNDLDLNRVDLSINNQQLCDYIKKFTSDIDYLVIHFGILEGLRIKGENQTVYQVLIEFEEWIRNENCKLIITSGRGHTPDIKKLKRFFIAYSTISNLLLDPYNRSKSHLIYTLSQLRNLK